MARTPLTLLCLFPLLLACQGQISDVEPLPPVELPPELPPGECAPETPEHLAPRLTREQFAHSVEALFPVQLPSYDTYPEADDVSALSSQQAGALLDATLQVADAAAADLGALLGCSEGPACVRAYLETQLPLLFRRPVDAEHVERYVALQEDLEVDLGFGGSVTAMLSALLMAPEFLYRDEPPTGDGRVDAFSFASRLSFFLWQQSPDEALLRAAREGVLDTEDGLRREVERLLADERSSRGYRAFVEHWLELERFELPADIESAEPAALIDSMRESMARGFIDAVRSGTFADVFTSETLWIDSVLAGHLGLAAPREWTSMEDGERRGVLTHPAIMTSHGAPDVDGRVIRRGVFMYESFLCVEFGSPPADAVTSEETRTESSACRGCHTRIDPVGYAFEGFDSGGRVIGEGALNITGAVAGTDAEGEFAGLDELSRRLAESHTAQRCFTRALTSHAVNRALSESEACVADAFAMDLESTTLRELITNIVTSELFRQQRTEGDRP